MIELILFLLLLISFGLLYFFFSKYNELKAELNELSFSKKSQSVKYGKLTEQWIPFSKDFPFDSSSFRFLGNPIDGIAFNENSIVFCEFKSNTSSLSEKQKKIRKLVQEKKVEWLEMHLKDSL
jgi:predicted Holliday junction resolvase-like endonuclease